MKGSPGISAVIFDMAGLMLDTEPLYKVAWQQASTELGYELDDTSYLKLVGRPTPDCEEELIKQFGDGFPLADCYLTPALRRFAQYAFIRWLTAIPRSPSQHRRCPPRLPLRPGVQAA